MNKTQKILIAIGVGVGVAYLYKRYKKRKSTTSENAINTKKSSKGSFTLPEDSVASNLSREEKEEFILDNVFATPQEETSGFEGVRFVWNPTIGKMYPVGTIQETYEPNFGEIFNSAEGDIVANIPNSVQNAEASLKQLNDQELELIYRITKTMSNNPSVMTEEDAINEMGITNPNIIKIVREKLKKRLNDIKILKKDSNWNKKWSERKDMRSKRRIDFKQKMGFDKANLDQLTAKKCGRKPMLGQKAQYKKCVETIANNMRSQMKDSLRSEISSASVSAKDEINKRRQEAFSKQMTNRSTGGVFAGKRWDGESNTRIESLVDKGLV